jgi:hypothetical protein
MPFQDKMRVKLTVEVPAPLSKEDFESWCKSILSEDPVFEQETIAGIHNVAETMLGLSEPVCAFGAGLTIRLTGFTPPNELCGTHFQLVDH